MNEKPTSQTARGSRVASYVTPVLVLGGLGLIGWWGHTYHWDLSHAIPSSTGKTAYAATAKSTSTEKPDGTQGALAIAGELPAIEFTSAEVAHNCGLDTAKVVERAFDDQVTANAEVGFDETRLAQLAVRVPGIVSQVEKRMGDRVEQGEALVLVDSAEVGAAKSSLLEASVVYRLKLQHRDRLSKIQNAIAGKEFIEAEAACQLARTQRFNALQKLINMGFSLELKEVDSLSEEALAERLHLLGLPVTNNEDTDSYNLIPLFAPFEGTIIKCEVVQGEMVQPLVPLYSLADTKRMWIHLNVRQDDASKLKIGVPIVFQGEMSEQPVQGVISWIGSEIDPRTRTIHARANVENPLCRIASEENASEDKNESNRVLRAGTFGTAKIILGSQPALAVPNIALHWVWEIGKEVIFVASEDGRKFQPVVVEKGLTRENYVQILSGLKAGDTVVTTGSRILAAELSEHLQNHIGDNASAKRDFEHSHDIHTEQQASHK